MPSRRMDILGLMLVRPARLDDLPAVYAICDELGMPAEGERRTRELLGHVYAGPYVVGPKTRSVVVVDDLGVAGYLLCATDTSAFTRWCESSWWPGLRSDYPRVLAGRSRADQEVVDLIHSPPVASARVAAQFPAHLHIDLLPRVRGGGLGSRLIRELLVDLSRRGIPGIHLDVGADNARAIALYSRLGFVELERGVDSVFMGRRTAL